MTVDSKLLGCYVGAPYGLTVAARERMGAGGIMFAEVVPAPPHNWRPWRGRTARWWYEVHSTNPDATEHDLSTGVTWAYVDKGSGGAFTLRRCVRLANAAVDEFWWQDYQERKGGGSSSDSDHGGAPPESRG